MIDQDTWMLTMKPGFLHAWTALAPDAVVQVQQRLERLVEAPLPDGKESVPMSTTGARDPMYRLTVGDHHIYYKLDHPYINLLALHLLTPATTPIPTTPEPDAPTAPTAPDAPHETDALPIQEAVATEPEADFVPPAASPVDAPPDPIEWPEVIPAHPDPSDWLKAPETGQEEHLVAPVSLDVLQRLDIPEGHHKRLLGLQTRDALFACAGEVPDAYLVQLDDALGNAAPSTLGPDQIIEDVRDLERYRKGELTGFLLKLNPEQNRFVTLGMEASGATLLKGGPGTGKSTVALYRTWRLLDALRKQGIFRPRILFTTYTNALVNFSKQLLHSILGEDDEYIDVRTADNLVMSVVMNRYREKPEMADRPALMASLETAIERAEFAGNRMQQKAQETAIKRLNPEYLLEEIQRVIVARRIYREEDYLAAPRPGRRLPFNKTQRKAVWSIYKTLEVILAEQRLFTWEQLRARAVEMLEKGHGPDAYDAVLIDEAQDLDASVLQLLVGLCKESRHLFVTADANQSIYSGSFRWSHVHTDLNFRGRTGVLRANHRSTEQIGEAAHRYLSWGAIEDELEARTYVSQGPRPAVRAVAEIGHEVELLHRFFKGATRDLRFGLGSCAVLCPTRKAGERIAQRLQHMGMRATFMTGQTLDLKAPGAKVMTLKTAKGLEFPLVAIAGFLDAEYPRLRAGMTEEEREEVLTQERRTMFVGMTRAMRALLMVIPAETESSLLQGFDPELWDMGTA